MAEINTIIDDLAAAVKADTTIDTWAQVEYDQGLAVLENCDPQNLPEQDDCPLVILFAIAKSGGFSQGKKAHVIGVSCAVWDTGQPESIEGVIRFTGGRNVETLRGYVVDVIRDNVPEGLFIESIATEYEPIDQFPYVSANMELTLTQDKLIGSDPLE